ncbi:S8 family serine peptidase [Pseudidiomarina taiwanensis]|uniref:S8 family serine peptidase n=1 Tax=Pseudidiomarina taiwanensis TaxID=337250 RepID=UPI001F5405A5|nr:S8 family serine peptidase [Pseudidiomarina taiwanensis]
MVQRSSGQKNVDLARYDSMAVTLPSAVLKGLQNNPNVVYVEEDAPRQLLSTEFEPGTPYGIVQVQADQVSDVAAGSRKVCIIDSGYDLGHPDLQSASVTGRFNSDSGNWYTDENGHGTHVAGTIAVLANGDGVVGVLPNGNVNLHIVKVFSATSWSYSSSLIAAATKCADEGANVINMSPGCSRASRTEERAFTDLNAAGVLSIAAAGNDGNTRHSFPASYDAVVSVAGVAYDASAMDETARTAATGKLVDCGEGVSACASAAGEICLISRGTVSFAEKVQACEAGGGVGAIIYNNEPGPLLSTFGGYISSIPAVGVSDTDGATMMAQLGASATAKDLGAAGRDNACGHGLVQAKAATDYLTTYGCAGNSGGTGGGGDTGGGNYKKGGPKR